MADSIEAFPADLPQPEGAVPRVPRVPGAVRFGDLAIEMNLLDAEQVEALVQEQQRLHALGHFHRLDELAVRSGVLARADCDQVLKALQERRQEAARKESDELVAPCRLGPFEVEERLQGLMGAVYRALDTQSNREVDLKLIPASFQQEASWWDRTKFECRVASTLTHPNNVDVYGAGEVDGRAYVAMAHVAGEPLIDRLNEGLRMKEREAMRIGRGLALALYHAHVAELLYRDVQPGRVLMDLSGEPRLYGLGVLKAYSESPERAASGLVIAHPYFLSPEQIRGEEEIDGRADLYGLGATLFQLLTGRPPFEGDVRTVMDKHLNEAPPDPGRFAPRLSKYTRILIMKLLAKDPARRIQSADRVAGIIGKILEPPPIHTGVTSSPAAPPAEPAHESGASPALPNLPPPPPPSGPSDLPDMPENPAQEDLLRDLEDDEPLPALELDEG